MRPLQVVGFYILPNQYRKGRAKKEICTRCTALLLYCSLFVFRSYEAQIMNKCLRHMSPRPLLFCWTKNQHKHKTPPNTISNSLITWRAILARIPALYILFIEHKQHYYTGNQALIPCFAVIFSVSVIVDRLFSLALQSKKQLSIIFVRTSLCTASTMIHE